MTLKLLLDGLLELLAEQVHAAAGQLVVQVRDDEVQRHGHLYVHAHSVAIYRLCYLQYFEKVVKVMLVVENVCLLTMLTSSLFALVWSISLCLLFCYLLC